VRTRLLVRGLGILLGLVIGAALIYALLPAARAREDRQRLSEKRAWCQVFLIGPSYADMVVPSAFDDEAQRIGLNKRFCHLGRTGMVGFELEQEIEFALSHDWPKLELVLVDVTLGETIGFQEANWFKSRAVEWHTVAGMKWLLDHYRGNPKRWPKLRIWVAHVRHLLAHYASLGRAPELVGWREPQKKTPRTRRRDNAKRAEIEKRDAAAAERDAKERRAKKSRPEPEPQRTKAAKARARKAKLAKSKREASKADSAKAEVPKAETREERALRTHQSQVAELIESNRESKKKPRYFDDAFIRRIRDKVRARGKEAFFVYAPVYYAPKLPISSERGKDPITLLRFNDPERFPELYLLSSRGRTSHLRVKARPIYARILADELHARWKRP
jgi:hypothetical protein